MVSSSFITFFVLLGFKCSDLTALGLHPRSDSVFRNFLTIVATNIYSGISKFLLAIPFFVLSGNIMAKAGISPD